MGKNCSQHLLGQAQTASHAPFIQNHASKQTKNMYLSLCICQQVRTSANQQVMQHLYRTMQAKKKQQKMLKKHSYTCKQTCNRWLLKQMWKIERYSYQGNIMFDLTNCGVPRVICKNGLWHISTLTAARRRNLHPFKIIMLTIDQLAGGNKVTFDFG